MGGDGPAFNLTLNGGIYEKIRFFVFFELKSLVRMRCGAKNEVRDQVHYMI